MSSLLPKKDTLEDRKNPLLSRPPTERQNRRKNRQFTWPQDGAPKAGRRPHPRVSRTCVCANTCVTGWHRNRIVVVVKPSVRRCQWPPRGARMTVLTWPCSSMKECAKVTSKTCENGQESGVQVGICSPWTRSAPGCGDTSKASASRPQGRYRLGHRPVVLPPRRPREGCTHCGKKTCQFERTRQ